MDSNITIREGATVYAADGDKIGKVVGYDGQSITVEKGWLFPTDYFVPVSAIANQNGDDIYLSVTKDQALNSDWTNIPAGDNLTPLAGTGFADATGAAATGSYDLDIQDTATMPAATYGTTGDVTGTTRDTSLTATGSETTGTIGAGFDAAGTDTTAASTEGDVLRVPVHEEELTATKRPVEAGQVRIEKDVVAEERTLDVPVTEERARVTRRTVDRDVTDATNADAFQEQTIDVPLRSEQVDLNKRVRVAEEVEVAKEAVQRTERVGDTVRREQVRVEDDTANAADPSSV